MSFTYYTAVATFPFVKEQTETLVSALTEQAVAFVTAKETSDTDKDELLDDFYYETDEEKEEQLEALQEQLDELFEVRDNKVLVYYNSEEGSRALYEFVVEGLCEALDTLPKGAFGVEREACSDSKEGNSAAVYCLTKTTRLEAEDFFAAYSHHSD